MDGVKVEPVERSLVDIFDDLVRCQLRLYNALDDRLREQHGIAVSQLLMLKYLRDHTQAKAADIAAHFAIGIGTTSKALDRHQSAGWIRRRPHPTDRRAQFLELTAEGEWILDAAERTAEAALHELLETNVSPDVFPVATAMLAGLRRSLEQSDVGRPTG